jgi:hypothetical protein
MADDEIALLREIRDLQRQQFELMQRTLANQEQALANQKAAIERQEAQRELVLKGRKIWRVAAIVAVVVLLLYVLQPYAFMLWSSAMRGR